MYIEVGGYIDMKDKKVKEPTFNYHTIGTLSLQKDIICSDIFFHHMIKDCDDVRLLLCQSLVDYQLIETYIEDVEFFHSLEDGKKMILDVVARDSQGYLYNIEMQVGKISEDDFIRFQCYANKLLELQAKKGQDYISIQDVCQFIISDKMIEGLKEYQYDFHMYDKDNHISLPNHKVHMRIIQLPMIDEYIKDKEMEPIDEVMYLLSKGEENRNGKSKEVKHIMDEYLKYMDSGRALAEYSLYSKEKLYRTKINRAKQEAKESRELGRNEGLCIAYTQLLYTKYQDDGLWLRECTSQQLEKLGLLILSDISLEELKKQVNL